LEAFPLGHEAIPEARHLGGDYRHLLAGNYRVIFRVEGHRVIVLRVIHAARELLANMLGNE
jgi:plasmid stabilization system protein ParE